MKLLAIESSTEFLSLALQTEAGLTSFHEATGPAASQRILPEIQRLLAKAGAKLAELDGIVYGTGPGAFTGVRVAVGVTQGLAFGADLPVVGVSSVQAVAQAAWLETGAEKVLVCLDARMGEVYHAALIKQQHGWIEVSPPVVCKPQEVPAIAGDGWLAAGSGWAVFGEVLSAQYTQQISHIHAEIMPTAKAMLMIATPGFIAGDTQSAQQAAPLYIRNRVALTADERAQGQTL
ncbi:MULTISPECIES: tRNA (adenosine(37)-N6)-threonylcarbamoyltransferase complex dimerization subunit type 1 TsaB [unclassified Methylophilus]|uniref:tRNA (adenosine(37)-N6)-threonylcarbamoyltransferase complex dimerization subunit type 1 TsaB n=1 Tax=unclassified Methylophilus TaxID=2630143 RepID=UPI0007016C82|nr:MULTISPECIES: tRNA (adenosine(37)-N6)-threonylcarbamoyltransferase complex dimerization subunit type 1 TsaB [unclassified Methylophilus]KQT42247.1 tRNA threonylcarbamoyladenosine biosynthesis protein TsaB [Methylophilus sp. Leaf416]KQT56429.1 tRNA threonylcarbamoyladenosine biosynthesis protein TsaB [Methylophilus sp. Leaf459]